MATLSVGGTTVFDGAALQSGVTGAQFKSSTPVSGELLQHQYVYYGTENGQVISSSSSREMNVGPLTMSTPAFDTTSETNTIWSIEGYTGINNEGSADNWNTSMKFWVSYDGGSSWSSATPGSSNHGEYLGYHDDDNGYLWIQMKVYNSGITANQSNTKFGVCFYSAEGDNTRYNMSDCGGTWLSCNQYKI